MVDWACAFHRAVLNLPLTEATYMSTCLAETSLLGASLLPNSKGRQSLTVEPGLLSKLQIVWTVPGNCVIGLAL